METAPGFKNAVVEWEITGVLVVTLTQDRVALVDDTPFVRDLLARYRWHAYYNKRPNRYYMARWDTGKRIRAFFHRDLLGSEALGGCVVHLDGNTLNCRRDNLAVRTAFEVMRARNVKFGGGPTVQVRDDGYYVRWIDEHRAVRFKKFSGRGDGPYEQAIAYSKRCKNAASFSPAIRNLIN